MRFLSQKTNKHNIKELQKPGKLKGTFQGWDGGNGECIGDLMGEMKKLGDSNYGGDRGRRKRVK